MLVNACVWHDRKGRWYHVITRIVWSWANVAILNVALTTATISTFGISIITGLTDYYAVATNVFTLLFFIEEETFVDLEASQTGTVFCLNLKSSNAGDTLVEMWPYTFLAGRITVDAFTKIVSIVICIVVPLEILSVTAFRNLASWSNKEIAELGDDSNFVGRF